MGAIEAVSFSVVAVKWEGGLLRTHDDQSGPCEHEECAKEIDRDEFSAELAVNVQHFCLASVERAS